MHAEYDYPRVGLRVGGKCDLSRMMFVCLTILGINGTMQRFFKYYPQHSNSGPVEGDFKWKR